MTNQPDTILCPWCGAEMEIEVVWRHIDAKGKRVWNAWASCTNDDCAAEGPFVMEKETEQEAYAEAIAAVSRRYTPPIKPITIEDIMRVRYETAAFWIEFAGTYKEEPACHWYLWSGLLGYSAKVVGYCEPWFLPMADYGKTWRCWERKPTDEERMAAKWET